MIEPRELDELDDIIHDLHAANEMWTIGRLLAAQLIVLRKIEFAVTELLAFVPDPE